MKVAPADNNIIRMREVEREVVSCTVNFLYRFINEHEQVQTETVTLFQLNLSKYF